MDARAIMTTDVVTLEPDMSVSEAGELLVRYRIHGAPVVGRDGQLLGMVSLVDLVGRAGETVADVMTPDPVTAAEDTPVEELAGMMLEHMVRRIPIVAGGRVVGIVSASDIVQLFLDLHERPKLAVPSPVTVSRERARSRGRHRADARSRRS
ncbi:MAG: CBS domain-containing protein [Armatimonadota bacterium]|nr:CBS domain-containing protein [Armatimonadota bacterium]MDR7449695.1 CBS domain-containing protein [Armatimonadota bacterium]MDR7458389.1 CBS domain-containing protein [Armatimonadota bacterium]MDR7478808.1 CBS domain-containing protein [Armatimonadota bacterium]MDR7488831.1 CBS domain-containing protein [Armatimonadota bacterium]